MDRSTNLLFVRSKYAFGPHTASPDQIAAVRALGSDNTMVSADTIVCAVPPRYPLSLQEQIFADSGAPTWVDHYEVVQVGLANAFASQTFGPVEIYNQTISMPINRSSYFVARQLADRGPSEPTYGRKLLMVIFAANSDERRVDRDEKAIRRALNQQTKVAWHGRDFRAYCFTYHQNCDAVCSNLAHVLDVPGVADYLLVEPLSVPIAREGGLSPMRDWVTDGFRKMSAASVTALARRRRRSGQPRR